MQPARASLSLLCDYHPSPLPFVSHTTAVGLESELRALLAGFHPCGGLDSASCDAKALLLPWFQVQSFFDGSFNCKFNVCIIKQNVLRFMGPQSPEKIGKHLLL